MLLLGLKFLDWSTIVFFTKTIRLVPICENSKLFSEFSNIIQRKVAIKNIVTIRLYPDKRHPNKCHRNEIRSRNNQIFEKCIIHK